MSKFNWNELKAPSTCGECNFIGVYETGPYRRNPHCCCELIWGLHEEDYKVDKHSLDENCPLKVLNKMILERSNNNG